MAFTGLSSVVAGVFESHSLTPEALDGLIDDIDDVKSLLEELGLGDLTGSPYSSEVLQFVEGNRRQIARIQRKRVNADVLTVTRFMIQEGLKKQKLEGDIF